MSPEQTTGEPREYSRDRHREQFPALTNKVYLNYGGQGPLPRAALEAIRQGFEQVQEIGPFSAKAYYWMVEEAQQTREAIAAELGVPATSITLTEDTTVGCNIALWGIDWQPGDHLLLTDCEHHGVIAAVQELQRRYDIEVTVCPLIGTLNEGNPVSEIVQYLRSNTRLVVLSHVLWNTGQLLPLAQIVQVCRSHSTWGKPVRILVDAAQSVGVLPLNLTELGADFYAFTGHKWWCGPEGVGGLYVAPDALASLHPTFVGWRSTAPTPEGHGLIWQPDGRRFEIATSAYPLYAGLRAAIALHHQWGTAEERYQRILQLSRYLWEKLSNLPGVTCLKKSPPESGLISFQVADCSHRELVKFLENKGILVRTILSPDCARACVHYLSLESEIDRLIEALAEFRL